jgi:hypothetical protein
VDVAPGHALELVSEEEAPLLLVPFADLAEGTVRHQPPVLIVVVGDVEQGNPQPGLHETLRRQAAARAGADHGDIDRSAHVSSWHVRRAADAVTCRSGATEV